MVLLFQVDESKVEAIKDWPTPENVCQARSFHGLAGFHMKFVRDFSTIAASLIELTKKVLPSNGVSHKRKLSKN